MFLRIATALLITFSLSACCNLARTICPNCESSAPPPPPSQAREYIEVNPATGNLEIRTPDNLFTTGCINNDSRPRCLANNQGSQTSSAGPSKWYKTTVASPDGTAWDNGNPPANCCTWYTVPLNGQQYYVCTKFKPC